MNAKASEANSASEPAESSTVETDDAVSVPTTSSQSATKGMYKTALDKVNKVTLTMLACQVKVADVEDLRCTEDMWKEGVAKCKVVFEICKATPFGRVNGLYNGMKESENISLIYYIDKGWTVEK